jgi:hypothetical protein
MVALSAPIGIKIVAGGAKLIEKSEFNAADPEIENRTDRGTPRSPCRLTVKVAAVPLDSLRIDALALIETPAKDCSTAPISQAGPPLPSPS